MSVCMAGGRHIVKSNSVTGKFGLFTRIARDEQPDARISPSNRNENPHRSVITYA